MENNLIQMLLFMPPILVALTFHEFSHAQMAYQLGDPTAKNAGRLTLNPISHLDVMGTILLMLVHFGWAKPVPINPANFKNPRQDILWVSLAGPSANVLLAVFFGIAYRLMDNLLIDNVFYSHIMIMLEFGTLINLILAFFNMLPIPPLDGSKILLGIIPQRFVSHYNAYLQKGQGLLIILILLNAAFNIPVFSFIYRIASMMAAILTGASQ